MWEEPVTSNLPGSKPTHVVKEWVKGDVANAVNLDTEDDAGAVVGSSCAHHSPGKEDSMHQWGSSHLATPTMQSLESFWIILPGRISWCMGNIFPTSHGQMLSDLPCSCSSTQYDPAPHPLCST
eukprot:g33053.t1